MQATRNKRPAFLTGIVPQTNRARYLDYKRRLAKYNRRTSWHALESCSPKQIICEAILAIALVLIGLGVLPYLLWI